MTSATPDSPIVAVALPSLKLSESERDTAKALRLQLARVARINKLKSDYYEGKKIVEDLGISIPPQLTDIGVAVGVPGTVVDVIDELLTLLGWDEGEDDLGLRQVFRENHLQVEAGRAHLDALIYGTSFVSVGKGASGEPGVLVTAESTESCTAEWDYRSRRVRSALSQTRDKNGQVDLETLYLPNETILFKRVRGDLVVADRQPHKLGRVPVVRFFNRDRASDLTGRSEITKPLMYYTDAMLRTLLGMEVNREFYISPQRYALGAEPETFGMSDSNTPEENRMAGWSSAMGRLNVVPMQEDNEGAPVKPEMGQFNPTSPAPFIDQVRAYTQLVSSETGIPASMLGFVTENPPSDGAIDNLKSRLNARVERRQDSFGLGWAEVARLAVMIRDRGEMPDSFDVEADWRPVTTPTRAALADESVKLVGADILPRDSAVTLDRLQISKRDQEQLARDRRRSAGRAALNALTTRAADDATE